MEVSAERKFLHDLATPLATGRLLLKMLKENLEKQPPGTEEAGQLLLRIEKAFFKMEALHASHKEALSRE